MITIQDLKQVAQDCRSDLNDAEVCLRFTKDSREVKNGDVFVALKGENHDGHDYVETALKSGAKVALVSAWQGDGKNQILVNDTLQALNELAKIHRARFKGKVIGITGSSGKTTLKNLMSHVLSQNLKVEKTPANYNNEIGVPFSLIQFDDKADVWIVEMGMRGLGQIEHLCKIALPEWGVISMIGTAHIEVVPGGEKGIIKAKGELFAALPKNGLAFVNMDDPKIKSLPKPCAQVQFGTAASLDYQAQEFQQNSMGIGFIVTHKGMQTKVSMPVYGKHMMQNALAVFAIAAELGLSFEEISESLKSYPMVSNRGGVVQIGPWTIVDDTYNANLDSMQAAIESYVYLKPDQPHVAVLGDMLELGDFAKDFHIKVGQALKKNNVVHLYAMGEFADFYKQGFSGPTDVMTSHESVSQKIKDDFKNQGVVFLFKGSRSMQMEKIIELLG